MEILLLWAFYFFTFYAFLPGIISRTFGFRVFQKGLDKRQIALTFDDGPDEKYTPQLLDLLRQYHVKAAFFVVGVHAQKYPEIIARMHNEGHLIGIHNYHHKSNVVMRPGSVKKQIAMTSAVIERVTGKKPIYYRPPWGIVNLFDFSKKRLQIILWSSMFGDWKEKVGAARLTKRMLKRLRGGEVFLLHDCGRTLGADEDAPKNMLQALEAFLRVAKKKDYTCVRVDQMIHEREQHKAAKVGLWKRGLVSLWLLWEQCFHLLFRLETLATEKPIFHIGLRTYKGEPISLRDGEQVVSGDRFVELHFDNRRLYEFSKGSRSSVHLAIQFVRAVEHALPLLAQKLAVDEKYNHVKALLGISMIHRGAEHLGFDVKPMPQGMFAKVTNIYLHILLKVLHPKGGRRAGTKDNKRSGLLEPKQIWMSVQVLRKQYMADPEFPIVEERKSKELVTTII